MPPRKQHIKKLYKRLKVLQADDACLSAQQLLEIKFYLRLHHRCTQATIVDDLRGRHPDLPRLAYKPQFLTSQLEAQRLGANTARTSFQVWTILQFATGCLEPSPICGRSFPTLFRWQTPGSPRHYHIFAYLSLPMASRKYSVSELLKFRDTPVGQDLLDSLKQNSHLAEMVKSVENSKTQNPSHPRRLKKVKEDLSSTDSDEQIVFNGRKLVCPVNTDAADSADWKFSRREDSEKAAEPLSAPAGLAAQQSEGFQRFFKAVVSPTHVRVTAGGKIVPYTRNSTSPTAKWDKEHSGMEADSEDLSKHIKPENIPAATESATAASVPAVMMAPMASPMYPGFPQMYQPMPGQMPFYAMGNGMQFPYGVPQPPIQNPMTTQVQSPTQTQHPMPAQLQSPTQMQHSMTSQVQSPAPVQSQTPSQASSQHTVVPDEGGSTASKVGSGHEARKSRPAPIKVSPPDQFDQTRPFFYNGQFIYPALGSGQSVSPISPLTPCPFFPFAGSPAIARMGSFGPVPSGPPVPSLHAMQSSGGFSTMPQAGAAPGVGVSSTKQAPRQTSPQVNQKSTSTGNVPGIANPPITSIKPSEITKSQLGSLRTQLKYYEDQLQFNKHQIDEQRTQDQVATIRKLINQFEKNLRVQLDFEATRYTNGELKRADNASKASANGQTCQTPSRTPTMANNVNHAVPVKPCTHNAPGSSTNQNPQPPRRPAHERRQATGINSNKGADTSAALNALVARLESMNVGTNRPSPLTSATSTTLRPEDSLTSTSASIAASEADSATDAATENEDSWGTQSGVWQDFGSLASSARAPSFPSVYGQPYLRGNAPQSMKPFGAPDAGYTYARKLTDEEERARHVYWGKVSSKGLGLPKFDGKDFYPPSPIREPTLKSESRERALASRRPDVDFGYGLPSKTESDPFHATEGPLNSRFEKPEAKVSHAVPIIDPVTLDRLDAQKTPKASTASQQRSKNASPMKPSPSKSLSSGKQASSNRRALDRSSQKSNNDLWQNMLKKGPPSATVVPSFVSPTTATGYLPPLPGNATASLAPATLNPHGQASRSSPRKPTDQDMMASLADKIDENKHPREVSVKQEDAIADLQQRMLRDAEQRGIIESGWQ